MTSPVSEAYSPSRRISRTRVHAAADTPLLDTIRDPADLRGLTDAQLRQVAQELRAETIDAVSVTGGHLGAGLGVVELTVALHAVFRHAGRPGDLGRRAPGLSAQDPHPAGAERIRTLRQGGGLSGFTKRAESAYDPFGAAHSSTSISAGLGMAVARDLSGGDNNVIAVIGDGAMSAGMAYEAMNNAGAMHSRLIVILNDNDMSIAPPRGRDVGLISPGSSPARPTAACARRPSSSPAGLPKGLSQKAARAEEYARGFWTGGTMFEEMGFYYVGPIDGHNLRPPAARAAERARHGRRADPPPRRHPEGQGLRARRGLLGQVSRRRLLRRRHRRAGQAQGERAGLYQGLRAIADPGGRGGRTGSWRSPPRCRRAPASTSSARRTRPAPSTSAIAEQHAVTFAAGMATEGYKPFLRDLLHVPPEGLRPDRPRRGDPEPAGALS